MNYFAHAHRFLMSGDADPYFLAGAAVPDWLNVYHRRVKCRTKHVMPYFDDSDPRTSQLARGVAQHHFDDGWFHGTQVFTELSLQFAKKINEALGDSSDLRAGFLGHILVELLLDAELEAADRSVLDDYYVTIDSVDELFVEETIGDMCGKPVSRLAEFIRKFVEMRFLADYSDDVRLCYRVNQVLGRVTLPPLPVEFQALLPEFRIEVKENRDLLLAVPAESTELRG